MKDQDSLIPWYTKAASSLMGVKLVSCMPILAGAADRSIVTDAARRELSLSEAPSETVFFNLRPDAEVLQEYPGSRFDYVVGDSDAETDTVRRLDNLDMVYWAKLSHDHVFDYNQAVIMRCCEAGDGMSSEVTADENWLCIRRVGNENRQVFTESGDLFVRSKRADGVIHTQTVRPEKVLGYVFGKYHIKNRAFVQAATSGPFFSPGKVSLDAY
ncbi:MAG: hypothetical protein AAF234_11670 [Pseudomonadota bacterium]